MGKRHFPASTAHHLAFNPSPKIVELRCGLADRSRQTWTFSAGENVGCPGCLIWIARNGSGFVDWQARALVAEALLNAPEIIDFARAVQLEDLIAGATS